MVTSRAGIGTCIRPRPKLFSFCHFASLLGGLSGQKLYLWHHGHFLLGKEDNGCLELFPENTVSPCELSRRESTGVAASAMRTGARLFTLGFLSLSGSSSCSLSPILSSIIVSGTWRWQKQSNLELSLLPENEIKTNGPVIHKIYHL